MAELTKQDSRVTYLVSNDMAGFCLYIKRKYQIIVERSVLENVKNQSHNVQINTSILNANVQEIFTVA